MNGKRNILVVDDDPSIRLTLETGLRVKGFAVETAASGEDALRILRSSAFDAVLCDVLMPGGDGISVVKDLRSTDKEIPMILMTAQGSVEVAVKAVGEGATDFIAKPFEVAAVASLLNRRIDARLEKHISDKNESSSIPEDLSASGLIGSSSAMVAVYKLIAFAARTAATVLITGESGTGKELVANAIHNFSARASGKFISVNCSGLTETLLESELFGHEKGSFTGATVSRAGLFEAAEGGTIFLDELASTSAGFQASLLRVIQSGEIRRVGSTDKRQVDVRVIGASNSDLQTLANAGAFRADLFYRLSVLTIDLPPLRDRIGDIPVLTQYFLQRAVPGDPPHLTAEVWDALSRYSFPGNVRELENCLTRAVALCNGNVVSIDHLPTAIASARSADTDNPDIETVVLRGLAGDRPSFDELQKRYLCLVLSEVSGNRRRAAEVLGVNRRTIQRLIVRYGIGERDDTYIEDDDQDEADGE